MPRVSCVFYHSAMHRCPFTAIVTELISHLYVIMLSAYSLICSFIDYDTGGCWGRFVCAYINHLMPISRWVWITWFPPLFSLSTCPKENQRIPVTCIITWHWRCIKNRENKGCGRPLVKLRCRALCSLLRQYWLTDVKDTHLLPLIV